jgi:hypothetical protein
MRSSRIVIASDSQCRSRNCPGFDTSILRHSEIWGAADEAVLNKVLTEKTEIAINFFRSEIMASKRKAGGVVAAKEPQIADSEDEALGDLDLDKYALLITFFLSLFCTNYP